MIFKKLIESCDFAEDVWPWLRILYDESDALFPRYLAYFERLKALVPVQSKESGEVVVEKDKCGPIYRPLEVGFYSHERGGSLSFLMEDDEVVLGYEVSDRSLQAYGKGCIVAAVLNEMTFFGFNSEKKKNAKENMAEDLKDICVNVEGEVSSEMSDIVNLDEYREEQQEKHKADAEALYNFADLLRGEDVYNRKWVELMRLAKVNGYVVAYGYSNDLLEFDGAIQKEFDAWKGKTVYLSKSSPTAFTEKKLPESYFVKAQYGDQNSEFSWTISTSIPNAVPFIVSSADEENYCQGFVFSLEQVKKLRNFVVVESKQLSDSFK